MQYMQEKYIATQEIDRTLLDMQRSVLIKE